MPAFRFIENRLPPKTWVKYVLLMNQYITTWGVFKWWVHLAAQWG